MPVEGGRLARGGGGGGEEEEDSTAVIGGFNRVAFNNLSRFSVKLSFTGRLDDVEGDDDNDGEGRFDASMTFCADLLSTICCPDICC